MIRRLLLTSLLLISACASWNPPEFNRQRVTIEVINPYPDDLSVNINHLGGIWALGIVRAHQARVFNIYLLQDQPVFVLAANLDGYQELRQSVYLSGGCFTRVILKNAPSAIPLAAAPAPPARDHEADTKGSGPIGCRG